MRAYQAVWRPWSRPLRPLSEFGNPVEELYVSRTRGHRSLNSAITTRNKGAASRVYIFGALEVRAGARRDIFFYLCDCLPRPLDNDTVVDLFYPYLTPSASSHLAIFARDVDDDVESVAWIAESCPLVQFSDSHHNPRDWGVWFAHDTIAGLDPAVVDRILRHFHAWYVPCFNCPARGSAEGIVRYRDHRR